MAVEIAPLDELVDVIRPGGLAPQKAPRIQASLRRLREANGDHSLEFLCEMEPLAAREWLTGIDGVGVKTASVVLMMSFGMPLMPVDRHVERVSKRIGLMPPTVTAEEAHDRYLALLEPGSATRCTSGSSRTAVRPVTHVSPSATPAHRTPLPLRRSPRAIGRHGPASTEDGDRHADRQHGQHGPGQQHRAPVGGSRRTPRPSPAARWPGSG